MRRQAWAWFVAVLVVGVLATATAGEKIKAAFLRGGGHDWRNCPPILVKVLDTTNDFAVTYFTIEDNQKNDPKALDFLLDKIKEFDVLAVYTTGLNMTPEQEKGMCDFVANGGGFVGVHSATDSFKRNNLYWEMVGGRFAGHGGGKFMVHIYDKVHPITNGLKDFEIQDETYNHNYHKNAQMRSLVRMNRGDERQSMAWVSHPGTGRLFYTGLGHGREAWSNPQFQRLVVRGMYWAAKREVKDPPGIR